MKRIVITKYDNKYIAVFLNDDLPLKIMAFDGLNEYPDKVVVGLVRDVKASIGSSFVKISEDKIGFLKGCNYKSGSLIPVCIKKETIDKKDDEVTDSLSLTGVYSIVANTFKGIRYSGKLSKEYKKSFEEYLEKNSLDFEFGIILRSNAKNASVESVVNEISKKCKTLKDIVHNGEYRTYGSVLHYGISSLIEFIISEDINEYGYVLTDCSEVYDHINGFIVDYKKDKIDVGLSLNKYGDDYSLSSLISLKRIISNATSNQVYLKSGAHIVIEQTEALVAIDINSGNTLHKGRREEVIHKVNIEAAEAIIRQIKLRNLSGIIIADFINEKSEDLNSDLIEKINKYIGMYDKSIKCHGMTKLGLIEFSRKREYKPFKEQLWK